MHSLPWWVKLIIGVAGVGLLFTFFDMVERFYLFFHILVLPLLVLVFLNMITEATYVAMASAVPNMIEDLRGRVNHYMEARRAENG